MRNLLQVFALFRNGSRICALYKMTLGEFEAAEHIVDQKKYVVMVADHKTAPTFGCVRLVLTASFYYKYATYRDKIRPSAFSYPSSENFYFFCNFSFVP